MHAVSSNRSIGLIVDYFNNRLIDYNRFIVAAVLAIPLYRLCVASGSLQADSQPGSFGLV